MKNAKKVLFVDDEKMLREVFIEYLKQTFAGRLTIEQAENFAEAQKMLNEQEFNLLISDVELPDGKGFDLRSDCDKIFLSGRMEEYKKSCLDAKNCLLFFKKPVSVKKLVWAVRYAFQWE